MTRNTKTSITVLALVAVLASGCFGGTRTNLPAPVNPAPTEAQVQAARKQAAALADSFGKIGEAVDAAQLATSRAYRAGVITLQARDTVYQFILDLEPQAVAFTEKAAKVTSDPELKTTVREFLPYADRLVASLQGSGVPGMAETGSLLRLALALLRDYAGGGL